MAPKVLVDDCDPSITYTGSWSIRSQVDPTSKEFNGTRPFPSPHVSWAYESLTALSKGTRIYMYGTLVQPLTGAPAFRVTIDDGEPVAFNSSGEIRPTEADTPVWSHVPLFYRGTSIQLYGTIEDGSSQALRFTLDATKHSTLSMPLNNSLPRHSILYQSQDLAPGEHQLTVTYLNTSSSVYLDYWVYNARTDSQEPDAGHSPDKGSTFNKRRMDAIIGGVTAAPSYLKPSTGGSLDILVW
ncbi:13540_t:CDS:2, partial [Acaulospora colombiana]